ncbi:hypothetical protein ACFFIX_25085 [Metabacillus herbersteinensis]|uniref:Uncharacterized protein n=1 Tax=Metabacillus herbersteinensis TaxID=283816 RepID=A0ABV6GLN1_9BACI
MYNTIMNASARKGNTMNIKDFAEYTIELFSSLVLSDIEEFIVNGKATKNHEMLLEWLEWLESNRDDFTDETFNLVISQFQIDIGAMPIWFADKNYQDKVLECFKDYFGENKYFYDMFKTLYETGLIEDGLR